MSEQYTTKALDAFYAAGICAPDTFGPYDNSQMAAMERAIAFIYATDPVKQLAEALRAAARSLRTISEQAGKDEYMMDSYQIRGYANSRANVADAALAAYEAERSQ